jgi:hypothetical protein
VDQPYLLMNANQVKEASFRSSQGLPMEITPEAMQVADMFGVTYSEVMNGQIMAHNRVSGENVPLIEQTPAVQMMDNLPLASAKLFQSGLKNGSKAQMERALTPFTSQRQELPMRSSMRQGSEFENMFLGIGVNEGTRTADGGFNDAYYGHIDPGDGAQNRGTISARSGTPEEADRNWTGILKNTQSEYDSVLEDLGAVAGSPEHKALMFNILDLRVQAPAAVESFVSQIPQILEAGISAESLGKARHNAFINPATGRLDTTFPKETDSTSLELLQDQMDRAMTLFTGQRGGSI